MAQPDIEDLEPRRRRRGPEPPPRRRRWRLVLGLLVLLPVLAVGGLLAGRERSAVWLARRAAAADLLLAKRVPLDVIDIPATSFGKRWLSFLSEYDIQVLSGSLEERLLGVEVGELKYSTADRHGEKAYVPCTLLTPEGAPGDEVTIYLPSSAARQGVLMDVESAIFSRRLEPARRVLVMPLPVREQRGPPWPALDQISLPGFVALARQTALDLERAVEACRAKGWRVTGLAGYSLGGCLAAGVTGIHPDAFAGAELTCWAGGGDLPLLVRSSEHWLVTRLRRPQGMSKLHYELVLATVDPCRHIGYSRLAKVHLYAGWRDEVIPIECTQALREACDRAHIPVDMTLYQGGHAMGKPMVEWLRGRVPQFGPWW